MMIRILKLFYYFTLTLTATSFPIKPPRFMWMKYSQTTDLWSRLNCNIKKSARKWFIERAERSGINWNSTVEYYENQLPTLEMYHNCVENKSIVYPKYYLKQFHCYDNGNLEWKAALEAETATLNIALNYLKHYSPMIAAKFLRYNTTNLIKQYWNQHNHHKHIDSIVDLGCSIGISTEYLYNTFPNSSRIIGVDLSPYFLSIATLRTILMNKKVGYIHANAETLPFEDHSVDLVSCQFLFHEIPLEPSLRILQEIYRVLKPNGTIAILDMDPFILQSIFHNSRARLWAFTIIEPNIHDYYNNNMMNHLVKVGFQNIETYPNGVTNTLWLAQKKDNPENATIFSTVDIYDYFE